MSKTPIIRERRSISRAMRRPVHTAFVKQRPHQVQPIACLPVLAGDSVRGFDVEARVITDPLTSTVIGWWHELAAFYVRLTDFDEYDAIQSWMVNESPGSIAGMSYATAAWTYYRAGVGQGPDWLLGAMKPIIRHYFRSEGEDPSLPALDSVPLAGRVLRDWTQAARLESELGVASPVDYDTRWAAYQTMTRDGLFTGDFVEFLRAEGTEVPEQLLRSGTHSSIRKPELIAWQRTFAYPQLSQDPTNGNLSAICSWANRAGLPKRRRIYCDVPGFIVVVSVARPKVYLAAQQSRADGLFAEGRVWRSTYEADAPQETLVKVDYADAVSGILNTTDPLVIDTDGVLYHGDQFVKGSGALTTAALLQGSTLNTHYPTGAEVDGWFSGANKNITLDGYVRTVISTRRKEEVVRR